MIIERAHPWVCLPPLSLDGCSDKPSVYTCSGNFMKQPIDLIKQLRAEGMSLRKIYLTLKERGFVSASGKPISTSTIYLWLKDSVSDTTIKQLVQHVLECHGLSADKKTRIIREIVSE